MLEEKLTPFPALTIYHCLHLIELVRNLYENEGVACPAWVIALSTAKQMVTDSDSRCKLKLREVSLLSEVSFGVNYRVRYVKPRVIAAFLWILSL